MKNEKVAVSVNMNRTPECGRCCVVRLRVNERLADVREYHSNYIAFLDLYSSPIVVQFKCVELHRVGSRTIQDRATLKVSHTAHLETGRARLKKVRYLRWKVCHLALLTVRG